MALKTPQYPRGRRPPSVTTAAIQDIKEYIHDQGLAPGEAMPTETDLCDLLGYSRSSIREAIRVLSALDIVAVRHGHGMYVSNMSLEPLVNGLVFRIIVASSESLSFLGNVVDAREALDLSVAEELVGKISEETRARLQELVERMRVHVGLREDFLAEDQEFHQLLLSTVKNPLIRELSDAFWQVHSVVMPMLDMEMVSEDDRIRSADAHRLILDAVVAGDPQAYRDAVREHYAPLRSVIEKRAF